MAGLEQTSPAQSHIDAVLTDVRRLQQQRAHRDRHKTFFVEGVRNCIQALDRDFSITTLLYSEKLLTVPPARQRVRRARRAGVPTRKLTPEQFRSISTAEKASGIGAIVSQHWSRLKDVTPDLGLCWVVLETVRSPGNFGTLIRTSEAVGGAGFILLGTRIDPFDPNVVRASMGSVFKQRFIRTSHLGLRKWIQQHRPQVVGASPQGRSHLHHYQFSPATLVVLGDERKGLTSEQACLCDRLVNIPMVGDTDSLNLAVAGSLMLYEVLRSRSLPELSRTRL